MPGPISPSTVRQDGLAPEVCDRLRLRATRDQAARVAEGKVWVSCGLRGMDGRRGQCRHAMPAAQRIRVFIEVPSPHRPPPRRASHVPSEGPARSRPAPSLKPARAEKLDVVPSAASSSGCASASSLSRSRKRRRLCASSCREGSLSSHAGSRGHAPSTARMDFARGGLRQAVNSKGRQTSSRRRRGRPSESEDADRRRPRVKREAARERLLVFAADLPLGGGFPPSRVRGTREYDDLRP